FTLQLVQFAGVAPSHTLTVIGCDPAPATVVPSAGLCVMTSAEGSVQLSEDCARTSSRTSGTSAEQFASAVALCSATALQFTLGGVVSTTVTIAEHVLEAPELSVTVNVTVVGPSGYGPGGAWLREISSPSGSKEPA